MGFVRDLWNDPDPTKWVIFGGTFAAVALGGLLVWQKGRESENEAAIARLLARSTTGVAPRGSLQQIADVAAEVLEYRNLLDPAANARNTNYIDPDQPTLYISQSAGPAKMGDLSIEARPNANVGPNYKDDVIQVRPKRDSSFRRENIQYFLFNVQIQPEMKVTQVRIRPAEKDHKPGMTLPEQDMWTFESQITYRKVSAKPTGG